MDMQKLARIENRKTGRCSSWDKTGRNQDVWTIPAGQSRVLADIRGPGIITHLWMTQLKHYRECLLKITWDNAPFPSVLCPLGDFFGLGHGLVNSYQSALFTASTTNNNQFDIGCALNSYVAMPFRKRALVELINESAEAHRQYFYVDYETTHAKALRGLGYFHTEFRRTNPFGGWAPEITVNTPLADVVNTQRTAWRNNYVILETRGQGHYLGCNLSVTNFEGTWWGEGDDMIWVDGYKWPPDLHGTGSEDYLNQAWGMQPNAFLRNGSSIYEMNTAGYQTSYVHHLENPVRFRKDIKVTIEHGHGNHLANEMSSVAYWYAAKPTRIMAPPPVTQRLPVLKENGRWALDRKKQCPGLTVVMTGEMKRNKRKALLAMPKEQEARRFLEASPWRSGFVLDWDVSERLPPAELARLVCPRPSARRRWHRRRFACGSPWMVDVHSLFGSADGLVYFANRFRVEKPGRWALHLGHDGGAKVFMNGAAVFCDPARCNPATPTRSQVTLDLKKGTHDVVIALDLDDGYGWGIAFSFEVPPEARRQGCQPAFPEVVA